MFLLVAKIVARKLQGFVRFQMHPKFTPNVPYLSFIDAGLKHKKSVSALVNTK